MCKAGVHLFEYGLMMAGFEEEGHGGHTAVECSESLLLPP